MKLFGHAVDGSALKAGSSAAKAVVTAAARAVQNAAARARARTPAKDRDAAAELRRRAELNARADSMREQREASLFGEAGWLPQRAHWLDRRR